MAAVGRGGYDVTAIATDAPPGLPPIQAYADLLLAVHDLIAQGKGDTEEAEALADKMDGPWHAMTEADRGVVRGLSRDLYALAEGGGKQVEMSAFERLQWSERAKAAFAAFVEGSYDRVLELLCAPFPADVPRFMIPFVQARCWEKLGLLNVAIRFMKVAERFDPHQAFAVLLLLQKAGYAEEAADYANRILDDSKSTPLELYFAGGALLSQAAEGGLDRKKHLLERLVPIMQRAFNIELNTPPEKREIPRGGAGMAAMIAVCLANLGSPKDALTILNEGLAHCPNDGLLLTLRGMARHETHPDLALEDFARSVEANAVSVWPYYFLAHSAIRDRDYHRCWQMCLRALERPGPPGAHAQLHEWLGLSRLMLGQPIELVLGDFDRAEELAPGNERIRVNRALVEARVNRPSAAPEWKRFRTQPEFKQANVDVFSETMAQAELLTSQRGNRIADRLMAAA
jgi:tetratricopeptide (TPR) repeat protein